MKSTKKSWKRRRHRNGVRPQRKGNLKVNLRELPTALQHFNWINDKLLVRSQLTSATTEKDNDLVKRIMDVYFEKGYKHAIAALDAWKNDDDRYGEYYKEISKQIKLGQRANDFFINFRQTSIEGLAEMAIDNEQPNFHNEGRAHELRDTCLRCPRRDACPFTNASENLIEILCPIIRLENNYGIDPYNEPSIKKSIKPEDQGPYRPINNEPFLEAAQRHLS